MAAEIRIGTSGYSFADWVGSFYPTGMKSADFLPYYAQHFPTVELNTTYYGIPDPSVLARMADRTPEDFRFMVKVHKTMTHDRKLDPAELRAFRAAIAPLQQANKYEGLLAQFPRGFRRTIANRKHLADLRAAFADEPLFVEFRHDSWLTPELEPSLKEYRIGYCAVDEPELPNLLPRTTMLTTEDAYVRFHGRNAANWYAGDRNTRYDYSYSREELSDWLKKIGELAEQARRVYLFFNNCHAGQAARSAKLMQDLLRQQGMLKS